jgi:hypothetical protein
MRILCSLNSVISVVKITGSLKHNLTKTQTTRPLSLTTVATLIHKTYCKSHLTAEGHTATGSGALFKFPEFFSSTTYRYFPGRNTMEALNKMSLSKLHGC